LGVHKSLEQSSSTITQTLIGLALDKGNPQKINKPANGDALQRLLNAFVVINVLHLCSIISLAFLQSIKNKVNARAALRSNSSQQEIVAPEPNQETSLLVESEYHRRYSSTGIRSRLLRGEIQRKEQRRGQIFMVLSLAFIISAWILFMGTAWLRLGSKGHRS